jgi:hypothetical protein
LPLSHADDADGIGVEHLECIGARDAVDADRVVPDAGVVDQHVEVPFAEIDLAERRLHRGVVSDVELHELGAERGRRGSPCSGLRAPT